MNFALMYWKYIAMAVLAAAAAFFFMSWQKAVENTGVWKQQAKQWEATAGATKMQLNVANEKIKSTSKQAAVSYGHCQDLVANDASKNFDMGVIFGRATCPATSSVSPVVRDLRSQPAIPIPSRQ